VLSKRAFYSQVVYYDDNVLYSLIIYQTLRLFVSIPTTLYFKQTSETPLHVAAHNGHTEVCKMLLDVGAGINTGNKVSAIGREVFCKHATS
jgi:Ankyrin repeats (3 copies)